MFSPSSIPYSIAERKRTPLPINRNDNRNLQNGYPRVDEHPRHLRSLDLNKTLSDDTTDVLMHVRIPFSPLPARSALSPWLTRSRKVSAG